jgi:hypothetical protein
VLSSPTATEEIGALGREIESRQDGRAVGLKKIRMKSNLVKFKFLIRTSFGFKRMKNPKNTSKFIYVGVFGWEFKVFGRNGVL